MKKTSQKPISSHAMLALNNLILKSKKYIGIRKASDIVENQKHAFEFLLQIITLDDHELRLLAKEVNQTLKVAPNLINAVNAYLEKIYHEKKSQPFIYNSQYYLKLLAKHLYGIAPNSSAYRLASSAFLLDIDKKDYTFCINLVRCFFSYWSNANQNIAQEKTQHLTDINEHTKSISDLWSNIENTFITAIEEAILKRYELAIQKINIADEEIETRKKIAKVIMIRQRKYQKTPDGYRANIADMQAAFSNKHMLNYFLSVSREFYHGWENTIINKN